MVPIIMAGIATVAVGFMCVFLVALCRDGAQPQACLIVRLASFGQDESEEIHQIQQTVGSVELRPVARTRQAPILHLIPQMNWKYGHGPDDKVLT